MARAPQWINNNFFFKCKNIWVGLNTWNVFALSPSSNKVFLTVAPWKGHSRAALNTLTTNFFPFNFFPFKIFPILFFLSLIFFLFSHFFSYCKEKINWCDFFYIVQSWVMIYFFSFETWLNFLIKTCLFLPFKNTFKKFWIFFSSLNIDIFWCFYIILIW